jgi:hypothetical protein
MIPVDAHTTLSALGVGHLSTVDVVGQLPSQGFAQLHQLVEHLHEMLAPVGPANTSPPAVEESSSSREPIMHAIDAEIKRGSSSRADAQRFCSCLSCTRRPNSTLWLCGALLHSPDAAVVNITFRVVQLMLHASVDCPAPLVYFDEESGAITLGAREAEYGHVFEAVQEALTPEGVAIASLLSQRLVMLPLTPTVACHGCPLRDLRASPLHALTGISPLPNSLDGVAAGVRREDASAPLAASVQEADPPRTRGTLELARSASVAASCAQSVAPRG